MPLIPRTIIFLNQGWTKLKRLLYLELFYKSNKSVYRTQIYFICLFIYLFFSESE